MTEVSHFSSGDEDSDYYEETLWLDVNDKYLLETANEEGTSMIAIPETKVGEVIRLHRNNLPARKKGIC